MIQSLWARVEGKVGQKAARYAATSVVAVGVTQVVLVVGHVGLGWGDAIANVVAVSVGAVPSYVMNRRWAWGKTGKNHLWREVVPFWGLALLGLGFSTGLVAAADRVTDWAFAPNAANLTAFGILWVGKYMFLDAVLFRIETADGDRPPITVC